MPQTNQKATHTIRFYIGAVVVAEHHSSTLPARVDTERFSGIRFIDAETGCSVFMSDRAHVEIIAHDDARNGSALT